MSTSSQISRMSSLYDRNLMEWEMKIITIRELIDLMADIDVLPVHQRIDTTNDKFESDKKKTATKRQGIVSSIFKGTDIGEIKINERTPEERLKYREKYESIDGGHRKRAIRAFFRGEFCTNPYETKMIGYKQYSDLTDQERDMFLNFKVRVVIYRNLSPTQKAMLWATSNNFTALNHQEQVNGVGDVPVANLIRQLARTDRKTKTFCHDLFDVKQGTQGDTIGEWLTFTPNRLTYDRLVARIATIVYNGSKPCNVDDPDIEKMYYDTNITQTQADIMRKKVTEVLDFLFAMAENKLADIKTKMTEDECIMLIRLWFTYQSRYDSFKITDMDRYYDQFRLAWIRFHKDTDDVYALQLLNGYDNSKEKRNRFAMFKDNHGKGSVNRWLDNIKWIENRFMDCDTLIEDGILVVKQSRKTLTKELREQILQSQDNKCYIDGKPLKFKDAHAAHIVPLDEGGSNDRGNIRMVRAEHNTRMGTMNLEDYKDMWYNKPKAA